MIQIVRAIVCHVFASFSKQPSVTRNELINFISDKCPRLFVPRETESLNDGNDDYGIRGKLE